MKKVLLVLLCFAWYCTVLGQVSGKLSTAENKLLSADSVNILESERDLLRCKIDSLNQIAAVFSESYCDSAYNEVSATGSQVEEFDNIKLLVLLSIMISFFGLVCICMYITDESPSTQKRIIMFVVWAIISGIIYYFSYVFFQKYNFYEKQYREKRWSYRDKKQQIEEDPLEFWALKTDNSSKLENCKKMLAKQSYIEDILHRNECVKDSLQQISDSIELAKEMRARAEAEILEKKKFNDWKMRHDVRKRLTIVRLYWDSNPDVPEKGNLNGDYQQEHSRYVGNSFGNLSGNYTGRIVDYSRHYLHLKLSDGTYLKIDARSNGNERWLLAEIGDIVEYSKIFSSYQHFTEGWKLL